MTVWWASSSLPHQRQPHSDGSGTDCLQSLAIRRSTRGSNTRPTRKFVNRLRGMNIPTIRHCLRAFPITNNVPPSSFRLVLHSVDTYTFCSRTEYLRSMLNMMVNTNLMLIYDICYYAPSPWLLLIVLRNTHDNLTVIFIADRTVCVYQTATSLPVSQWSRSQANCRAFLPYMIRTSTSTSCAIFSSS